MTIQEFSTDQIQERIDELEAIQGELYKIQDRVNALSASLPYDFPTGELDEIAKRIECLATTQNYDTLASLDHVCDHLNDAYDYAFERERLDTQCERQNDAAIDFDKLEDIFFAHASPYKGDKRLAVHVKGHEVANQTAEAVYHLEAGFGHQDMTISKDELDLITNAIRHGGLQQTQSYWHDHRILVRLYRINREL